MNRHEPQNIDTEILQARYMRQNRLESTFGSELAYIHLINYGLTAPVGMIDSSRRGSVDRFGRRIGRGGYRLTGKQRPADCGRCHKKLFHDY